MSNSDDRNIVLTGFMGTGKTTVGRTLAELLGFDFVDTDAVIEERHGPIATIFRDRGEEAFRTMERDLAAELSTARRLVVATGGRMMLDPANLETLGAAGQVFCLVAAPATILDRVLTDSSRVERPLLQVADTRERIVELLAEREAAYRRFVQIPTDDRSPPEIAGDIAARFRST